MESAIKPEKLEAVELRSKGYSYNEISEKLSIPKSTLSGWLKNIELSKTAKTRLDSRVHQGTLNGLVARNKLQTIKAQERAIKIQLEASSDISNLTKDQLRIVGTALYWAEGYKRPIIRDGKEVTSHAISFVNADPAMIRIFIRFLTECLEVPLQDIRATMRLYEHIDEENALLYWKTETGLPSESFRNSTFQVSLSSKGVRPFNRLEYGTLQIGVYKTAKFHEIIGLIEGMKLQAGYANIH